MADEKYVKKLRFSDGRVYYYYDVTAARAADLENYLALSGGHITGDLTIDGILSTDNLRVVAIDDREIPVTNVLTQDMETGAIQRRGADDLLSDIGGCSYTYDSESGTLALKNGR